MIWPSGAGFCKHDNELPGSVKREEFLDHLSDCQFLKKISALWNWLIKISICLKTGVKSRNVCYILPQIMGNAQHIIAV
jgi:hypothetical protein